MRGQSTVLFFCLLIFISFLIMTLFSICVCFYYSFIVVELQLFWAKHSEWVMFIRFNSIYESIDFSRIWTRVNIFHFPYIKHDSIYDLSPDSINHNLSLDLHIYRECIFEYGICNSSFVDNKLLVARRDSKTCHHISSSRSFSHTECASEWVSDLCVYKAYKLDIFLFLLYTPFAIV